MLNFEISLSDYLLPCLVLLFHRIVKNRSMRRARCLLMHRSARRQRPPYCTHPRAALCAHEGAEHRPAGKAAQGRGRAARVRTVRHRAAHAASWGCDGDVARGVRVHVSDYDAFAISGRVQTVSGSPAYTYRASETAERWRGWSQRACGASRASVLAVLLDRATELTEFQALLVFCPARGRARIRKSRGVRARSDEHKIENVLYPRKGIVWR